MVYLLGLLVSHTFIDFVQPPHNDWKSVQCMPLFAVASVS